MRRISSQSILALVAALGLLASACAELTQDLPQLTKADLRFRPPESSKLFAADGSLITTFHGEQNRTVIPLRRIPEVLQHAVIAIEDQRFYEHGGVDVKAIIRAAVANISSGSIKEGGSTITQQYVKNVIIAPGETAAKTLERKIDEAALARQIEQRLSKDEILERYLNTIYFGQGAYGAQAAAKVYFGKPAHLLTLKESAMLAGLLRAPGAYDPYEHPKLAKARRNVVLDTMASLGYAKPIRVQRAKLKPLGLQPALEKDRYAAAYFVDYVKRLLTYDPRFKALGRTVRERTKRIFQGGLRIYTTVDLEMQHEAEAAVSSVLPYETDPHASLVAIEPQTGFVKAMVGGRDYFGRGKGSFSKLNLAIMAEPGLGPKKDGGIAAGSGRQAGSAFKPFALAAAVEAGVPLGKTYDAAPCMDFPGADAGGPWHVCNYESSDFGSNLSLLEATINSVNVVYAQLIMEVGAEPVVDVASAMGIRTTLLPVNSAVLGTNVVNPLGMSSAYATFATNGTYHPPVAVTRITDSTKGGKVVYEDQARSSQAISPVVSYIVTSALQQVVSRGTGTRANIGRPVAGKTGTAQEYRDAWFGGYTPDLAAAVWVGYPEGEIEMKAACASTSLCRPTRIYQTGVTGGSYPAEIWASFMGAALAGHPATNFSVPGGIVYRTVDVRFTGGTCLASDSTPSQYRVSMAFPPNGVPTETCSTAGFEVEVPDVFGFPVDEAVATLEAQGLDVNVVERKSRGYEPHRVIAQAPRAGQEVAEGSTVTIFVSVRGRN